jgi:bifunctional non-homologous end joining protein LigD
VVEGGAPRRVRRLQPERARPHALLELARRDEEEGLGDAPWPPHFPKQRGEPKRVQPSRDRERPTHRGRAGDPQPGGPPPGVSLQRGFGSKPRTGQGYEHEFDD